jgi:hypothetical protein
MTNQEAIDFIESEQIFTHLGPEDCRLCEAWQTLKKYCTQPTDSQQPHGKICPHNSPVCRCGTIHVTCYRGDKPCHMV